MNAALETMMLALRGEGGPGVPRRGLMIGAEPHPEFGDWPEIIGWQPFKPLADAWERAGFARVDSPQGMYPLVLVLPGKSRDETLAWFALAKDLLEPGGRILAAMPNTAGAGRFEQEFARACGGVTSVQKHKCRAFCSNPDASWDGELLGDWKNLGIVRQVPGTGFVAQAGLFSCDHIDPGSALLAEHLPGGIRGRVADLGAGWGFLSDAALRRCSGVTAVDLYEADARALDCARINLANSARPVGYHWHDVAAGLPETYDAVVMNPPFHRGQDTRVDLGRAFIAAAAGGLRRGGALYLVANRQLPYEAALDAHSFSWRHVGGDATYKLIHARKR